MLSPLSSNNNNNKKEDFFSLFFFQTFKEFLKEVVNMNMKLWKFSKSQPPKLLGFGKHGKTLFKTIVEPVIAYHKKRKFSGHLLGKLHFFLDLRVKHPFDPIENVTCREFLHGKMTNLLHMRYHSVSF